MANRSYKGISRSQELADYFRLQIIEAECPACHKVLDRGKCECCGSFSASPDGIFLAKGANPSCCHWPILIAEGAIHRNAYIDDVRDNLWFDIYISLKGE